MSGADEIFDLARDFAEAGPKVGSAVFDAFKAGGEAFAEDWSSNAQQTAGSHAPHYPGTITSETKLAFGVEVETGPEESGQGLLGRILEFGSATSGAHLDGARAMPAAGARIDRLSDAAIGHVLP